MNATARAIVLLEDDAVLRGLMAESLAEAGFHAVEVATGQLAQAAMASAAGHVILVADRSIDDGGPNGFQVAADALEQYPDLRVIYVTGTHIAVRRRSLGERERALLKPFAIAQLLGAVRDLAG